MSEEKKNQCNILVFSKYTLQLHIIDTIKCVILIQDTYFIIFINVDIIDYLVFLIYSYFKASGFLTF